jgi:serine/threonine protein phosphatase PrpC
MSLFISTTPLVASELLRDTYISEKKTHNVLITQHIEQMCSAQDETFIGKYRDETGEEFDWCMVADGHGSDFCINILRNFDKNKLNNIISKKNPIETLFEYINNEFKKYNYNYTSGSTICLVKYHKDYVEVISCGDSQAAIFKNGELVLLTEEHDWKNESERERLLKLHNNNIITRPTIDIKVSNNTDLIGVLSDYIRYPDNTLIACSQSLGHNGITGCSPYVSISKFDKTDSLRVIVGSDGLWDMIMKDNIDEMNELYKMEGTDILQFAINRWLQKWNMIRLDDPTNIVVASYERHQCDDIGFVVMDIMPIV